MQDNTTATPAVQVHESMGKVASAITSALSNVTLYRSNIGKKKAIIYMMMTINVLC